MQVTTSVGSPSPLGATPVAHPDSFPPNLTVNFALHSTYPEPTLLLFPPSASGVTRDPVLRLPLSHRTGFVSHLCVANLPPDYAYVYMLSKRGAYLALDPHAKWLETPPCAAWMTLEGERDTHADVAYLDARGRAGARVNSFPGLRELGVRAPLRLCRFVAPPLARLFDWEGARAVKRGEWRGGLVIYEAHVRALTKEGTFAAAVEVVPYLKWLGVTALQLMPVLEFSELEVGSSSADEAVMGAAVGRRRGNYWGYSPLSWYAVMNRYAGESGGAAELKMLVKALHEAGIECFLDMVYNHSSHSCSLNRLGLARDYYMNESGERGSFRHYNVSGCGNTLSPNSPLMLEMIMESLRWFVSEYCIDGFRLDAAGVLCRDAQGHPLSKPAVIEHICADPVLARRQFIVEGWDAGDQIGSPNVLTAEGKGFPHGERFCEWNVHWRDAVRRFVRGDEGSARAFCKAMRGSPGLFGDGHTLSRKRPLGANHGINFVACHDGFCLRDVLSYEQRVNADGYDEVSFNCGEEGATTDPAVLAKRARQARNFVFALAVSRGVPMMTQGDEFGFTKQGNSNTWNDPDRYAAVLPAEPQKCNELEGLVQFTRRMLSLRKELAHLNGPDFFSWITWLDESGRKRRSQQSGWIEDSNPGFVAFSCDAEKKEDGVIYVAFNNGESDIMGYLPRETAQQIIWTRVIDTANFETDSDFFEEPIDVPYMFIRAYSSFLARGRLP